MGAREAICFAVGLFAECLLFDNFGKREARASFPLLPFWNQFIINNQRENIGFLGQYVHLYTSL